MAHRPKHAHSPNAENYFLTKTVVGIAAIELAGKIAITLRIAWQVGVQELDGDLESTHTFDVVPPAAQFHPAIFNGHIDPATLFLQEVLAAPVDWLFGLRTTCADPLATV